MNILVIDDWQFRHDWIQSVLSNHTFPVTFRNRYAPKSVTTDDLDWAHIVFLDHDLCEAAEHEQCPNPVSSGSNMLREGCGCPTGWDMTRRIIAHGRKADLKCVVHTANPAGGKKMAEALKQEGFWTAYTPAHTAMNHTSQTLHRLWGVVG